MISEIRDLLDDVAVLGDYLEDGDLARWAREGAGDIPLFTAGDLARSVLERAAPRTDDPVVAALRERIARWRGRDEDGPYLRLGAKTDHATAESWWSSRVHLRVNGAERRHPVVPWGVLVPRLDSTWDDFRIAEDLIREGFDRGGISHRYVGWARQALADARTVEEHLRGAVRSWGFGHVQMLILELRQAWHLEIRYDGDSATQALARQLLIDGHLWQP